MGTGKVIFIRADANSEIASGHIMRCLTIAGALRRRHHHVTFLVSDEDSASALTLRGESSFVCLNSNYRNLEEELSRLLPLLKEQRPDVFLLDSYFASASYMQVVRKLCKLVYLDDLQSFPYPADLIINYDLSANAAMYGHTPSLTGGSYTPLREQFAHTSYQVREQVSSILISTGGSDNHNAASEIFRTLNQSEYFSSRAVTYHILTGNMNPHRKDLYALSAGCPQVEIHENITEMAALIASCDLAFSAGGTTLFELCAVGVPAVSFSISDEQFNCVQAFADAKVITYAGDVRDGERFYQNLLSTGIKIAEDPSQRNSLSASMKQFVDGQGAERIAEEMMSLLFP